MKIEVKVDGLKNAEKFSEICQRFPFEFFLRSDSFCIDPKSMLGVLAIFYSAKSAVYVDTNEMDDETIKKFSAEIGSFVVK